MLEFSIKVSCNTSNKRRNNTCVASFSWYFSYRLLVYWDLNKFFFSLKNDEKKKAKWLQAVEFSAVADVEEWRSDCVIFWGRTIISCGKLVRSNKINEIIEVLVRALLKILMIYTFKVSNLAPEFMTKWCFAWFIGNKISCVKRRPANLCINILHHFQAFI